VPIAGERSNDDGELVAAAARIDNIGEKKRLAIVLIDAADILPADKGMELRILINGPIYRQQQALFTKRIEMLVEIGVAALLVNISGLRQISFHVASLLFIDGSPLLHIPRVIPIYSQHVSRSPFCIHVFALDIAWLREVARW
jgi:hypothetical protein